MNHFLLQVQGVEKLVHPKSANLRYYVHMGDLFATLLLVHKETGHGGRDRMLKEVHQRYKNITRNDVEDFLRCCESCEQKRSNMKKGIVVRAIIS